MRIFAPASCSCWRLARIKSFGLPMYSLVAVGDRSPCHRTATDRPAAAVPARRPTAHTRTFRRSSAARGSLAAASSAAAKSGWNNGSPPDKRQPAARGAVVRVVAEYDSRALLPRSPRDPRFPAPGGRRQAGSAPQHVQRRDPRAALPCRRPSGLSRDTPAWHAPQAMHRPAGTTATVPSGMLSGLPHHRQRSGQPLKNTVVRMPGPSWSEKRWMSKMRPVAILQVLRPRDDLFLHLRREIHEELAETGHAHDEVAILLADSSARHAAWPCRPR